MVVCGTAYPEGEQGLNIGRQIAVKVGLPLSVAGITVNQFCASSQQAVMMIADALACGKGEIGLAVGLEHMARVPQGGYNPWFDPELAEKNFYISMGDTAEVLAREGEISREDQEAFAMESHRKALYAALCDLVDEFLDDLGDDENFCISELPEKYRLRYDGLFRRRFLVTLLTVGYKLALPEPLAPLPSCTAEELALHILIEQAKNQLQAEAIEPDFSLFEGLAFQDGDYEVLYDMSIDGIEDALSGGQHVIMQSHGFQMRSLQFSMNLGERLSQTDFHEPSRTSAGTSFAWTFHKKATIRSQSSASVS